jgi:hypothetical protein
MTLARGVDIHPIYQAPIDWPVLAQQVEFVIVKLTEGRGLLGWQADGVNDSHVYYQRSRDVARLTGGYHLCHPENNTPTIEAVFYASELEAAGWQSGRDLPPILDVEPFLFTKHNLDGAFVTDWSITFCHLIDDHFGLTDPWLRTMFYVGASIFNYFDYKAVIADRKFWHGGYGATEWPTDMPPSAAIYQKVNKPITLVQGIGGGDLDIDVARPEDLARLAPAYYGEDMPMTTTEQDALIKRLLGTQLQRVEPTATGDADITVGDAIRYAYHRSSQVQAALAGLPDEIAAKVSTGVTPDQVRQVVIEAISPLRGLLPGE